MAYPGGVINKLTQFLLGSNFGENHATSFPVHGLKLSQGAAEKVKFLRLLAPNAIDFGCCARLSGESAVRGGRAGTA